LLMLTSPSVRVDNAGRGLIKCVNSTHHTLIYCRRMKGNQLSSSLRVQVYVLLAGLLIMAAKFVAYFLTKSNTILTDALESIVNITAGAVGVYSLYLAAKPKDIDHPYGHGKAEFISASIEGTLIAATGLMMVFKSSFNLYRPQPLANLDVGMYLTAAGGILNYILGAVLTRYGKRNHSITLESGGKHLKTDAYTTAGILVGLFVIYVTGQPWLDNVIAIGIGIFILVTGVKILRRSIAGIMDEADYDLLVNVVKILNENRRPNWIDIHNMRIIKYGSNLHIDCHMTLPWYLNVAQAHDEVQALEDLIAGHFPQGVELFIHTDACMEPSCSICAMGNCDERKKAFVYREEWTLENVMRNEKHRSAQA